MYVGKKKHKSASWALLIKRVIFIILGATLVAFSLEMLMVPNKVIDGGVVGISIMLSYLTNINLGIFLFVLNLPFFVFGYKQIGKTFTIATILGVAVMSIGTVLFAHNQPITNDPLLAAIFGGIILGIGIGLVLRYGGSLDGTEILAIWISRRTPFSIGQIVMFFNLFILGSAGFVFGSWDRAMYSLIAYYIAFKIIDLTVEGFDETKAVWIISDHHEEISEALLKRLGRGVTFLNGEGAYTGDLKKVIFCVVTRLEEAKLKTIVEEIDTEAFLAIGNIHDVRGKQFAKNDIH
ncbi:DUF2179 domain-containing protein [Shimazuella sp. KC615]|uniref:DUF2179 domain-containing protein n=1 Tax=Shimazuella alba TaxID=2690964 RepID=A0A6I4VYP5_9BACL|nr:DUF2179 domain-containing protein [Shimazuella alba]